MDENGRNEGVPKAKWARRWLDSLTRDSPHVLDDGAFAVLLRNAPEDCPEPIYATVAPDGPEVEFAWRLPAGGRLVVCNRQGHWLMALDLHLDFVELAIEDVWHRLAVARATADSVVYRPVAPTRAPVIALDGGF